MKEHKKLYKSGKLWMTATIMAFAAGATLATTDVAHAQTTSPSQSTTQSSADAIAQQQQKVTDDQSAVTNAQNDVDKINGQLTTANQKLTDAKKAQSDAQAKLDQANKDQQSAQSTMDQLEQKAKDAKKASLDQQIQTAQSSLDQTNSDLKTKQNQVANLTNQKKDLEDHQGQSTNPNIVNVPNGNLDTTKSLLENAARNNLWTNNNLKEQNNGNIIPQNTYIIPNDNDDYNVNDDQADDYDYRDSKYAPYFNIDKINPTTGMTDAQKEELAILLMNMINHAREQRGLAPFIMTKDKYDQAQVRAAQNSAATLSHNEDDIRTAFGNDQYENLAYIDASETDNMLSLLYNADDTISNMLNADASSSWGHRHNFLEPGTGQNAAFGFHYIIDSNTGDPIYVFTFDFNGGRAANDSSENMMDRINTYAAEGPVSGGSTVDNTAKINDLNTQIDNLNTSIKNDQTSADTFQKQINDLKNQENNLVFVESDLSKDDQATYDAARQNNNKAVLARTRAQQDLDNAKTAVNDAQQNVNDFTTQLNKQNTNLQNAKDQLANDQKTLDAMKAQPTTPTTKTDAETYTNLDASALTPVTVAQNATTVPAPAIADSAIIKDSSVMALDANSALYPAGTTAVWADADQVVNDAKTAGKHTENVYLLFPDGTKSDTFAAPDILIVTPASKPSTGDNTKPSTGDNTKPSTGDNTQPSTDNSHKDKGTTTPTTPSTTDHGEHTNDQAAHRPASDQPTQTELPAGSHVVNNHVVDAHGNVVSGWKVVNGQAVKTNETTSANTQQNAKQLPQTGNDEAVASTALGIAAMASLLGLGVLNKKRA